MKVYSVKKLSNFPEITRETFASSNSELQLLTRAKTGRHTAPTSGQNAVRPGMPPRG